MPTIANIEDKLIETIQGLNIFALVQSAGRKELPEYYAYPACFVIFDGDQVAAAFPRPVDTVSFSVVLQVQNMAVQSLAARDAYVLNDLVRDAIRGKTLGLDSVEPFTCASRKCTGYDDSEGVIEYTHTYSTRLYNPVPAPG